MHFNVKSINFQRPIFKSKPYKIKSLVHSDTWGHLRFHFHWCWINILKDKNVAKLTFKNFHNTVNTQHSANNQNLHSSRGTWYFYQILGSYLNQNGIISQSLVSMLHNKMTELKEKIITLRKSPDSSCSQPETRYLMLFKYPRTLSYEKMYFIKNKTIVKDLEWTLSSFFKRIWSVLDLAFPRKIGANVKLFLRQDSLIQPFNMRRW